MCAHQRGVRKVLPALALRTTGLAIALGGDGREAPVRGRRTEYGNHLRAGTRMCWMIGVSIS